MIRFLRRGLATVPGYRRQLVAGAEEGGCVRSARKPKPVSLATKRLQPLAGRCKCVVRVE